MWNDPEVFGGFLLVRRLAESRMANVSIAVRLADASGRPIVLKRPPLGERASGRAAQAILREAEVLSEVKGAGLPALEAAGDIAGLPYVAVERLRGASLAKVLATGRTLPFAAVRAIGRDVGRALEKLHAAGWVHRDVTPSNLFIDESGEAYLLDFGLCERDGDERGAPLAGTRGYAAPEAPTAPAPCFAEDVYGLAVCLAEAAIGRRLFEEGSLVEAAARGNAPPKVAALEEDLPGITAALSRDPSARPTAEGLASMLAQKSGSPGDPSGSSVLAEMAERAQGEDAAHANEGRATEPGPAPAAEALALRAPAAPSPTPIERAAAPFGPPPRAVTPTMSMPGVVVREAPERPSGIVDTVPDLAPIAPRAEAPSRSPGGPVSRGRSRQIGLSAAALLVVIALAVGFVLGRGGLRARGGASFAIAGPLPKRAEVLLDNKKLTIADGVPMPVPAGSHTLTISTPKNPKREIPFSVNHGEHVVIVSPLKANGQVEEEGP